MEREACVCDHGFERSDLCAEIIIIIIGVPDYSREKYLGTTKASTRRISVHVQMYNIFRLLIGVSDYSTRTLIVKQLMSRMKGKKTQNTHTGTTKASTRTDVQYI